MMTAAELRRRATMHRPRTLPACRRAIADMRAEGHGDYSIALALGLGVEAIRHMAGPSDASQRSPLPELLDSFSEVCE
jgi:hypothetical protein